MHAPRGTRSPLAGFCAQTLAAGPTGSALCVPEADDRESDCLDGTDRDGERFPGDVGDFDGRRASRDTVHDTHTNGRRPRELHSKASCRDDRELVATGGEWGRPSTRETRNRASLPAGAALAVDG
jgi:hypothetical protein